MKKSKVKKTRVKKTKSEKKKRARKDSRKNIRKIIQTSDLCQLTKTAEENELARKKRLEEKEKAFSEKQLADQSVLDFDAAIVIDKNLFTLLKTHQVQGIKFMWNSCFESSQSIINSTGGGGCILAHCMGLGKSRFFTLQNNLIFIIFTLRVSIENENIFNCS